jgi:CRISPR-associated endonuclease Csn1
MKTNYLIGSNAPLTKLPRTFPTKIDEDLYCGIDIGVGSCGVALVSNATSKHTIRGFEELPGKLTFLGIRAFDLPEEKTTSGISLKNPDRRQKRLMRRVLDRRAQRIRAIKNLLVEHKILPQDYDHRSTEWKGRHESATPWRWRVQALSRKLSSWEFAVILIHYAKRRGFKSAKKSDLESKGSEGGTLQSSRANHAALEQYETVADLLMNDPRFVISKSDGGTLETKQRNRDGEYIAMVTRADVVEEIRKVFSQQRALGNEHATDKFEEIYLEQLNKQRAMQDPIKLLGDCPFIPSEKRSSVMCPSFELARALQKLNGLQILSEDKQKLFFSEWILQHGGYGSFVADFGRKAKITWGDLRKMWQLPSSFQFADILSLPARREKNGLLEAELSLTEKERLDFSNRSSSSGCAQGSFTLRKALGEQLWNHCLQSDFAELDYVAFCLTFYEVVEEEGCQTTMLGAIAAHVKNQQLFEAVARDLRSEKPTLHKFKGSASTSAALMRHIIPFLMQGQVYSTAMESAGFQHVKTDFTLDKITNPIVKSVLREAMKQIAHVFHEVGCLPGRINIEVARDVGKSIEERNEIDRGIKKRTTQKNVNRLKVADCKGSSEVDVTEEELLRYELYLEQGGMCPYSGRSLPNVENIYSADLQVDHIQPRSRSHDNSFDNKVLVYASANQNKGNQTPFEWLAKSDDAWEGFQTRISSMRGIRRGKRNRLLSETFATQEPEFLERNLNDTRYISRLLLAYVNDFYRIVGEEPEGKGAVRRVFSIPGSLTSLVRKAWGLENLKKDVNGNRVGDKHHAVDALVCACLSHGRAQWITKLSQAYASSAHILNIRNLTTPWTNFRNDVVNALDQITVSRRERCGAGGALHQETNYGLVIDSQGNQTVYKRQNIIGKNQANKPVATFQSIADLENIRGINEERSAWLKEALTSWVQAGSPLDEDKLPRDTQGCLIRKVFVAQSRVKNVRKQKQGHVTSGTLVRCDVFSKAGKYFLVPIYNYQLSSATPPMRAVVAAKEEDEWAVMDDGYHFEFSLWKNSRFQFLEKKTKATFSGCYSSINRNTGVIEFKLPDDYGNKDKETVSPKSTISDFRKLNVDRLGRVFVVKKEKRVWRGVVCI